MTVESTRVESTSLMKILTMLTYHYNGNIVIAFHIHAHQFTSSLREVCIHQKDMRALDFTLLTIMRAQIVRHSN